MPIGSLLISTKALNTSVLVTVNVRIIRLVLVVLFASVSSGVGLGLPVPPVILLGTNIYPNPLPIVVNAAAKFAEYVPPPVDGCGAVSDRLPRVTVVALMALYVTVSEI
jgi:hypothetical protein